ncbi:hypothetical protein Gpo141_00012306 [Globisporangium polare]
MDVTQRFRGFPIEKQAGNIETMDHQGREGEASAATTPASLAAAREEYLEGVAHRVETYESCANAIATATASLQELSANLDKMKSAAQQLNAFTSGWLAVWKRA